MLASKQFELLKSAVPTLTRVAVLIDAVRAADFEREAHEVAARTLGLQLQVIGVDGVGGLEAFFETAVREQADGVYLAQAPLVTVNQGQIAQLAMRYRLPAIAQQSDAASRGQLMGYGPNREDLYRRAATYVDKIIKGAKPGDIPAEQPTKFDFGDQPEDGPGDRTDHPTVSPLSGNRDHPVRSPSRRQFMQGSLALAGLGLLSGCAALPIGPPRQARLPRVGYLAGGGFGQERADGFRLGLADHGYVEGRNITVEWRDSEGRSDRLPGPGRRAGRPAGRCPGRGRGLRRPGP